MSQLTINEIELADEIPGASFPSLPGAAHLPPMEDRNGFCPVVPFLEPSKA